MKRFGYTADCRGVRQQGPETILYEILDSAHGAEAIAMLGRAATSMPTMRPSLALREKFGFSRVGYLPGVAYRYGRWADSVMMQRSLGLAAAPPPAFSSLR
jgi:L-amino acid N-acyltransferase YncA